MNPLDKDPSINYEAMAVHIEKLSHAPIWNKIKRKSGLTEEADNAYDQFLLILSMYNIPINTFMFSYITSRNEGKEFKDSSEVDEFHAMLDAWKAYTDLV